MRDPHSPGGHKVHAGLTPNLLSQLVDGREKKNRYEERRCRSHRPVGRLLFFFFSFFSNTPVCATEETFSPSSSRALSSAVVRSYIRSLSAISFTRSLARIRDEISHIVQPSLYRLDISVIIPNVLDKIATREPRHNENQNQQGLYPCRPAPGSGSGNRQGGSDMARTYRSDGGDCFPASGHGREFVQ